MVRSIKPAVLVCVLAMLGSAPPVMAQNKGGEKAQKQGEHKAGKQQGAKRNDQPDRVKSERKAEGKGYSKPDKIEDRNRGAVVDADRSGRDRADASAKDDDRGKGRFSREFKRSDLKPAFRRFAESNHPHERIVVGAVARGIARGLRDDDVVISPAGSHVRVLNRSGVVLLELNDERARNLGGWRVRPDERELRGDAPSFCRSGEGHPVWGRQWCIDKGFGLGTLRGLRWGTTHDTQDIVFRSIDAGRLARPALLAVLGDLVLDRLGLHAITLGYTDPLTGVWVGENTGPRVLKISSGLIPIAEITDSNRDNRADVLVVALKPW